MTRRMIRAIDLVGRAEVFAEYETAHSVGHVPAAVLCSLRERGVVNLDIYRADDRLVMVMEVRDDFDAAGLAADADANADIAAWNHWMGKLQKPIGDAEGWIDMPSVFHLGDHP